MKKTEYYKLQSKDGKAKATYDSEHKNIGVWVGSSLDLHSSYFYQNLTITEAKSLHKVLGQVLKEVQGGSK